VLEYDRIFDWYVADRERSTIGVPEAESLAGSLFPGANVLDLGCGFGRPITEALSRHSVSIYGLDSSPKMIAAFRRNFPSARSECARAQESPFFQTTFDAVVSWGMIFHLAHADQELVIDKVGAALNPGGQFLFTSGDETGHRDGVMNGVDFRYFSFSADKYKALLRRSGMELTDEHVDRGQNYYYLARKNP
jgi:2-polyprenyl-3-methyl-5-hydroxy-6-metoxy-1,4-benzoquinol methylase